MYFFSTNPWFSTCFKALYVNNIVLFVMYVTNKLITFFDFLSLSFKWKIIMKIKKICRIINIYFKNISFITTFIIISLSNLDNFFIHLKSLTSIFWDIPHPYKLFASKYIRYDDSIFYHNFSYIYYLFLHNYVLRDIFHP